MQKLVIGAILFTSGIGYSPVHASRYTVIELPPPAGGDASSAYRINDLGQVVGQFSLPGEGYTHPGLWKNGVPTDLFPPGLEAYGTAYGINNSGQIVGGIEIPYADRKAFLWDHGILTYLPTPPSVEAIATAINDRGDAIGYAQVSVLPYLNSFYAVYHPMLWHNGQFTDLGSSESHSSYANAVNDRGDITIGTYHCRRSRLPKRPHY